MSSEKKLPLDFESYPALWILFQRDKQQFGALVRSLLKLADHAVDNGQDIAIKNAFNLSLDQFVTEILDAFMDYKGITSHHVNEQEAKSMEILKHDNNPLSLFNGAPAYNAKGDVIPTKDFLGVYNIKEWMQGLLYASRYVPHEELVKYMYLDDFDMLDQLKLQNVQQLIKMQPSLTYQKDHNIIVGKRIPGTAYFDLGEHTEAIDKLIIGLDIIENGEYTYVPEILGGFTR